MRSDQELKKMVETELRRDPPLDDSEILVSMTSGTVALSGFVQSWADKHAAEQAAKRVDGVAAVLNNIEVRLPSSDERPDPEVARDVVTALRSHLPFCCEDIQPIVTQGCVILQGELDWHHQREAAEASVRQVKGVKGISNRIKMKSRPIAPEVTQRIQEAFRRRAAIDAEGITVEAREGDVILKGSVRSQTEREEADRAAWAAPGVRSVENRISVSDSEERR